MEHCRLILSLITGGEDHGEFAGYRYDKNRTEHRKAAEAGGIIGKGPAGYFGFATPQAIYKWQQGAALPTLDNLVVLAAVLQVRMDDILVITDPAAQIQISA
jgi:transcriptional regulator with XRE-family HTH domain